MNGSHGPAAHATIDAITAQLAEMRSRMLRQLNADIFSDNGSPFPPPPPPTADQVRTMRRERLKSLIQVRDVSDWDYDY